MNGEKRKLTTTQTRYLESHKPQRDRAIRYAGDVTRQAVGALVGEPPESARLHAGRGTRVSK